LLDISIAHMLKIAQRLWRLACCGVRRELWDTAFFRAQHPHAWAEVLDSEPGAAQSAIEDRKREYAAVELLHHIVKTNCAPWQFKLLKQIHWHRSQITLELVALCRLPEINWDPLHPLVQAAISDLWLVYGNTKYPLEDKFGGLKTMVSSEHNGGPKPGLFFEQVAMLEHHRTHPNCGPDAPMPSLSIETNDWDEPLMLPRGLSIKDVGDRIFDAPSFKRRSTEAKATKEKVDVKEGQ
jgi:hypothetical protein